MYKIIDRLVHKRDWAWKQIGVPIEASYSRWAGLKYVRHGTERASQAPLILLTHGLGLGLIFLPEPNVQFSDGQNLLEKVG